MGVNMQNRAQIIGKRFGRWTVLAFDHLDNRFKSFYLCRCDCGTIKVARKDMLLNGTSKSCGCLHHEIITLHGDSNCARLYNIWRGMKKRCLLITDKDYKNYGGRGIKICSEWLNYENFRSWALSNGYQYNLTIDRIDVNGNYCPENCRWATVKEQGQNTRFNRKIALGGKTQCVAAWCDELNISRHLVYDRLHHGWSPESALLTPVKTNKTKGEKNG